MAKQGTLRAEGISSIAVDKPTRAKLKELAGDMPVSHYVRGLAFGYIKPSGDAQEPIPGQEREVSKATIHSVKADTEQTVALMRGMSEFLSGFFEPWVVFQSKERQVASADTIEARLRWLADMVKRGRSLPDNSQAELNLG